MGSCDFCKKDSKLSCVCGKVSYCSKECQKNDWKVHKPSCPPFVIRESPGKGRGLFATRRIKEGQVIIHEYPLLTLRAGVSFSEFKATHFPNIDENTKAKILQLHDPAEDFKALDTETFEELVRKDPGKMFYKEAETDEMSKIYRIVCGNNIQVCEMENFYSTTETGLYYNISLLNNSCVPNATWSWLMGEFQMKVVRALMTIEKDEEILVNYRSGLFNKISLLNNFCAPNTTWSWVKGDSPTKLVTSGDFQRKLFRRHLKTMEKDEENLANYRNNEKLVYGSREVRRQELLETRGFLCKCTECSLDGWDLEDNDGMRKEIREKNVAIRKLLTREGPGPVPRRKMKKAIVLANQRVELVKKLNLRAEFVVEMAEFYLAATNARKMGISVSDPDSFKQEAIKYAKMFGESYIFMLFSHYNVCFSF